MNGLYMLTVLGDGIIKLERQKETEKKHQTTSKIRKIAENRVLLCLFSRSNGTKDPVPWAQIVASTRRLGSTRFVRTQLAALEAKGYIVPQTRMVDLGWLLTDQGLEVAKLLNC